MNEHYGILMTPRATLQVENDHPPHTIAFPIAERNDAITTSRTKDERQNQYYYSDSKLDAKTHKRVTFNEGDDEDEASTSPPRGKPMTLRRLVSMCSLATFLMAAVVGLTSNLYPVLNDELARVYLLTTFNSKPQRVEPDQTRVLFKSYHETTTTAKTRDASANGNRKPKLVIHMGPHKTASTTLQTDLTYYQDRLKQDDYIYLGRFYHPYQANHKLVLNRAADSDIMTGFRDLFRKCTLNTKKECVEHLHEQLLNKFYQPYRKDHPLPNLLISDEAFLKLFDDYNPVDDEKMSVKNATSVSDSSSGMNENYVLLKDVLGQHWDVVLVLAYRRFYEWLPSLKHQIDKPLMYEKSKVLWPAAAGQNGTVGGIALQPLFPLANKSTDNDALLDGPTTDMFDGWRRHHFFSSRTMDTIRSLSQSASDNFTVKIYHLYGKLSVRTNFLCRILTDADYSCRASRHQDALQDQETRINARSSAIAYPWAFFDAMATTAAEHGYIDTANWQRQTVARMLKNHYQERTEIWEKEHESAEVDPSEDDATDGDGDTVLEDVDLGNDPNVAADEEESSPVAAAPPLNNPWELPLLCPTERQFDQLLHLSLSLEATHLPKLYRKAAMEHRAAFRAATTSPASAVAYCWIDMEVLFGSDETSSVWKEFIVETFSSPATNSH